MYWKEHKNWGAGCWSWLGCYSLWFHYWLRSWLELWELQCNGQNIPLIGQLANTFTPSFRSMYWEEHINWGAGCWSWLGCYSLWFHYWIRSWLELYKSQCNGQNIPLIGLVANPFTPSFRSIYWEEHIKLGAGCWAWLGYYSLWFHYWIRSWLELWKLHCNGHNFPLIG
jgi:hypothetical protein